MADSEADVQKLPPTTQILSKPRQKPGDFLKKLLNNAILVKLNSGHDFRGILLSLDGYLNVVLEKAEEYVGGEYVKYHGSIFVRGNTVLYLSSMN